MRNTQCSPFRRCAAAIGVSFAACIAWPNCGFASIQVVSAERSISVLVDVNAPRPFGADDLDQLSGPGSWSSSLTESYSPTVSATATQVSTIASAGFSGLLTVSAETLLEANMGSAVANAVSRVEVSFAVSTFGLYTLNAEYELVSNHAIVPSDTPFLSVAGFNLLLPEPAGFGSFTLTIALYPGTYTFSAIAAAGGLVTDGGNEISAGSISLAYSFAQIPAPSSALLLGIIVGCRSRRRLR